MAFNRRLDNKDDPDYGQLYLSECAYIGTTKVELYEYMQKYNYLALTAPVDVIKVIMEALV